jgi:hypothetical protein
MLIRGGAGFNKPLRVKNRCPVASVRTSTWLVAPCRADIEFVLDLWRPEQTAIPQIRAVCERRNFVPALNFGHIERTTLAVQLFNYCLPAPEPLLSFCAFSAKSSSASAARRRS